MPDETKLRRRVLLKLLSSPVTMLPFLGGVTVTAASWALNVRPAAGLFVGLAGVLAATGTFFTRLLLAGEDTAKETIKEIQEEDSLSREAALDALDERLAMDGDRRTESALRDLRTFVRKFREERLVSAHLNSRTAFDVVQRVEDLFDRCVASLEESLDLLETARQMNTREARRPILDQRERIIREVGESVVHLGRILVQIQEIRTADSPAAGLNRIREELDRSLDVARRVDERMQALERELDPTDPG